MSDAPHPVGLGVPDASARSPGEILRAAREAQSLTLDQLAAVLKVTPAKLQALEAGRLDQLPDASFARALAQTMCRVLKIDPAPVLAGLPAARIAPLASEREPLNQPFKEARMGAHLFDRSQGGGDTSEWLRAKWLAPLGLLLAAAAIYLMPESVEVPVWLRTMTEGGAPASAVAPAEPASEVLFVPAPVETPTPASIPASAVASAAASAASAAPTASEAAGPVAMAPASDPVASAASDAGVVTLVAVEDAWIEVTDGSGIKRLSRLVRGGEALSMGGVAPWSLKIGNAGGVKVSLRGEPIELAAFTRNNVARLELK